VIALAPPVRLTVLASGPEGAGWNLTVRVMTGLVSADVLAALVPGTIGNLPDPNVYFFVDPAYPSLFDSYADTLSIPRQVTTYLSDLGFHPQVTLLTAPEILPTLSAHPRAAMVFAGPGLLPDTLFSTNTSFLADWVRGGGTLVWAGGPLAYFEGHVTADGGFADTDLGWGGETSFVGYPLTQPFGTPLPNGAPPPPGSSPYPPLNGIAPSPLAHALGIGYSGVSAGADLPSLYAHGGLSLGFETPPGAPVGARTSLAYLPLGAGALFFFGGALFSPNQGYIPFASPTLAEDIAFLVGLGYRPASGAVDSVPIAIGPLGSEQATLGIPDRSAGVIGLARANPDATFEFFWASSLA
jgi:hypothetical protein